MNVQLGSSNYFSTLKKEERLSDNLFLANKKRKATYEIKKENGYVRHIVTKENGEKVIVREVKISKQEEQEHSSGEVNDMVTHKLVEQMMQSFDDRQNQQKFLKTGIAGLKEKQISKYIVSI
jgi:hypothetical protein